MTFDELGREWDTEVDEMYYPEEMADPAYVCPTCGEEQDLALLKNHAWQIRCGACGCKFDPLD